MNLSPTPPPREPMAALIARSSLGARDAVRARARVRVEVAQQIVAAAARRPTVVRPAGTTERSAGTGRSIKPARTTRHPRRDAGEDR